MLSLATMKNTLRLALLTAALSTGAHGDPAPTAVLHNAGSVTALAFSPDGSLLAVGTASSPTVQVWDAAHWKMRRQLRQQTALGGGRTGCGPLLFLSDGWLATSTDAVIGTPDDPYAEIRIWNPKTGDLEQTLTFDQVLSGVSPPVITGLAASPDGRAMLGASCPSTSLVRWNVRTKAAALLPSAAFAITSPKDPVGAFGAVAFSPDGETIAACYHEQAATDSGQHSGYLLLWDGATYRARASQPLQDKLISPCLAFARTGTLAATDQASGVSLDDATTGKSRRRIAADAQPSCLAFDPGSGALLFGTSSGNVYACRPNGTDAPVPLLSGVSNGVRALAISRNEMLAVGDGGGVVRVWKLAGDRTPALSDAGTTKEVSAPDQSASPAATPRPILMKIDPASFEYLFPATNPDTLTIHLSGEGFTPGSVIEWGGKALPTQYISGSSLEAAIKTNDAADNTKELPGLPPDDPDGREINMALPVRVRNPDGGVSQMAIFLWTRTIVGG